MGNVQDKLKKTGGAKALKAKFLTIGNVQEIKKNGSGKALKATVFPFGNVKGW